MAASHEFLVTLLTDKFEVSRPDIRPDATLAELGLDSLDAAELQLTLQEEWSAHDLKGEITDKTTVQQAEAVARAWRAGRDVSTAEDAL
ncbi:acyl carrier protein [Streptomyces shenzhenensis]|uniref:acyl carrier protein n=1 Tax=Streptomyces shenzhenensis TaxID=943815 RepID=UPI0036B99E6E